MASSSATTTRPRQPTATFPVDGTLVGLNGADAVSGASDVMSILNNFNIRYAGGAVPQGSSNFFSAITLFNSRPTITNGNIADTGGTGGTEAAIAADLDSFREDDTARGPLIRQVTVPDNSLNGIWLMSEANGFIEPTNAMPNYPDQSVARWADRRTTRSSSRCRSSCWRNWSSARSSWSTPAATVDWVHQPALHPARRDDEVRTGSGLDVLNPGSSLNVGSRSYINGFDQNNGYSPARTGFVDESASDPKVLFTSIYDDTATTHPGARPDQRDRRDRRAIDGQADPGGVGQRRHPERCHSPSSTRPRSSTAAARSTRRTSRSPRSRSWRSSPTIPTSISTPTRHADLGTHVYITNNNFFNNFDAAMQIEPNGLLAGNPLTPLVSGHPFFRGNVMSNNGIDGLVVVTNQVYIYTNDYASVPRARRRHRRRRAYANLTVDSVWDLTDMTYVLQGTLIIDGAYDFLGFGADTSTHAPVPSLTTYATDPAPVISLTIQAALPGTLLADGETIPSPGQSVIVKLFNDNTPNDAGRQSGARPSARPASAPFENAGAGFVVGVDDGVDPPAPARWSIPVPTPSCASWAFPGNQTTGQQRVPVILTSLRDGTVGTTVRGVSWTTSGTVPGPGVYRGRQRHHAFNLDHAGGR